jgi:hypothetical protein
MSQTAIASEISDRRHSESNCERRVQIAYSVDGQKLQRFLPSAWRSASVSAGPSKGGNFFIAFRNRLLTTCHDADGTSRPGQLDRGAVLLATAQHLETGEFGFWVLGSLSASPTAVPGPYGNGKLASVRLEQRLEAQGDGDGRCSEDWRLDCGVDGGLRLYLEYCAGVPAQDVSELTVRGGPDPDFSRIYKIKKGTDVIRSSPSSIDRVNCFRFENSLGQFADILAEDSALISIAVDAWYFRQVLIVE